jgi:hypothetical protein
MVLPAFPLGSGGRDGRIARKKEDERKRGVSGMVENGSQPESTGSRLKQVKSGAEYASIR